MKTKMMKEEEEDDDGDDNQMWSYSKMSVFFGITIPNSLGIHNFSNKVRCLGSLLDRRVKGTRVK
jgi:hypothetical protein